MSLSVFSKIFIPLNISINQHCRKINAYTDLKQIVNKNILKNTNYFSSKFNATSNKTKAKIRHNDTDYFVYSSGQPTGDGRFQIRENQTFA